jgi:hypothetical protein
MFMRCPCGYTLSDGASPGRIRHLLLTDQGVEDLENAVDREVAEAGCVDSWWDHFQSAAAIEVWVCPKCLRLFLYPTDRPEEIIVYQRDRIGIPRDAVGFDSQVGTDEEISALAREHAGRSPLADRPAPPPPPTAEP